MNISALCNNHAPAQHFRNTLSRMTTTLSSPAYDRVFPPRPMEPHMVLSMWDMVNDVIWKLKTASEDMDQTEEYRRKAKISLDDQLVQRMLFWEDRSEVLLAYGYGKPN